MNKMNDGRGYDLDYYNLYLRRYLREHHFPEAEDDLFIASRAEAATNIYVASRLKGDEIFRSTELALAGLLKGLEISPYDFVSDILTDEFYDHISLEDESIEFWTFTFIDELKEEFKGITLGEEFFNTTEGEVFRLTVIGRITLFFEEYGL